MPEWRERHPESVVVANYRDVPEKLGAPVPYAVSAGLHARVQHWDTLRTAIETDLGAAEAVRRNAGYISKVDAFTDASYVRLVEVVDLSTGESLSVSNGKSGPGFELTGDRAFKFKFFNYHPDPVSSPVRYEAVGSSEAISFVGWAGFEIASRYDEPSLTVKAAKPGAGRSLDGSGATSRRRRS